MINICKVCPWETSQVSLLTSIWNLTALAFSIHVTGYLASDNCSKRTIICHDIVLSLCRKINCLRIYIYTENYLCIIHLYFYHMMLCYVQVQYRFYTIHLCHIFSYKITGLRFQCTIWLCVFVLGISMWCDNSVLNQSALKQLTNVSWCTLYMCIQQS